MILIQQKTKYECVITSVAMCMDIAVAELRQHITHNPEEVIWNDMLGVRSLRGIQIEDMLPIIYKLGYYCMPFFNKILCQDRVIELDSKPPLMYKKGLLMYEESHHVVAWNAETQSIYDPIGIIYDLRPGWVEFWLIEHR